MKQVLHLFQSGLPILPYQTNSDVGWGLMVFQLYITGIEAFFSSFCGMNWLNWISYNILCSVQKNNKKRKRSYSSAPIPNATFMMLMLYPWHYMHKVTGEILQHSVGLHFHLSLHTMQSLFSTKNICWYCYIKSFLSSCSSLIWEYPIWRWHYFLMSSLISFLKVSHNPMHSTHSPLLL